MFVTGLRIYIALASQSRSMAPKDIKYPPVIYLIVNFKYKDRLEKLGRWGEEQGRWGEARQAGPF